MSLQAPPDAGSVVAEISDRDLVLQFESLGDNCELGLVQRALGTEPLGLFRFAGAPLAHFLRGLNARFEDIAAPKHVRIQAEHGEYMVKLTKYDYIYHAFIAEGAVDPKALQRQQTKVVQFLADKFMADLAAPEKILVFRQNEPLLAADLVDLRQALGRYGGNPTLLWIQEARHGHPPGSVDIIDQTLMTGYVSRLALRESVPDFDLASWLSVLRRAWSMWPARQAPAGVEPGAPLPLQPLAQPLAAQRVDVVFGKEGNATAYMGEGWSGGEDGFTWSIDDRSLLTFDTPPDASEYWLEMDVVPYVYPPALARQVLTIAVNGTEVRTFDPVPRTVIGCVIPGDRVRGQAKLVITLEHKRAARPSDVAGEDDQRRLAIAFRGLSLMAGLAG